MDVGVRICALDFLARQDDPEGPAMAKKRRRDG